MIQGYDYDSMIMRIIMMMLMIMTTIMIEGSLEVKLPTIWRDEKQSREEA